MRINIYLFLFAIIFSTSAIAQSSNAIEDSLKFFQDSPQKNRNRVHTLNYSLGAGYVLSMAWLNTQWYSDYPKSSFHFFNDNSEWEQMDKFGHAWDAYNIAKPLMHCYRWAGYDEKHAVIIGTGISFLFLTTVEVLDGFSSQWGFSSGDMIANATGAALFAGQQLKWKEQRMVLKYSFHQTKFAKYNPGLLGSRLPENILKDYNGLTYWLTINPASFMKNSRFPKWLSVAFGYGADGMTGGKSNPTHIDDELLPSFERYRQYYLSLDFDLSRIETRSKFLSGLFKVINIVHLPAPAIEFAKNKKPVWKGFYF